MTHHLARSRSASVPKLVSGDQGSAVSGIARVPDEIAEIVGERMKLTTDRVGEGAARQPRPIDPALADFDPLLAGAGCRLNEHCTRYLPARRNFGALAQINHISLGGRRRYTQSSCKPCRDPPALRLSTFGSSPPP